MPGLWPVVFFVNGIGDNVMALPALRALAALYGRRLTLVGASFAEACFFPPLGVGRTLVVTTTDLPTGRVFDAAELAGRIGRCDLLISLNPWHTESVDHLLDQLRPEASVGFFPGFTHVLPLDFSMHAADMTFTPVRHFDARLSVEQFAEPLVLPTAAVQRAAQLRALLPAGAKVIAVHADTDPAKMWDDETVRQGLHAFLERRPEYFAFIVGSRELGLERGPCESRVIGCVGMQLANSMAVVGTADLFCGVDSSMLHVADISKVPGVGLFRTTNPEEFGFRFGAHRHLHAPGTAPLIAEALEVLAGS